LCYYFATMSRFSLLLVTASVLSVPFVSPTFVAAQGFTPQAIKFIGAPDYSDADLMAAAGLKLNVELTTAQMSDHTRPLLESGVIDSISYEFDGVNLIVHIKPVKNLYPISFVNLPFPPSPELDAEIHAIVPLYQGKLPSDGKLIENVRAALQTIMAKHGMKAIVAVAPYVDPILQQVTHVDYSVTAPVVLVGDITASGPEPELKKNVLAIAQRFISTPYDQTSSIKGLHDAIENYYTDRGFVTVKVEVSTAAIPVVASDSIQVPIALQIDEGPFYKLGSLHIDPGIPIPKEEIYKVLNMNAGDRIKGANLRALWQMILDRCKSVGYLSCTVTPKIVLDEQNTTASYSVSATPGEVYRVTKVKFAGFTEAQTETLMKDWKLKPGDPVDETFLNNFFTRMVSKYPQLGDMLKNKKINYTLNADPDPHHLSVLYTFVDQSQ
jgi:outer membrane protein assembly factor BamA